MQDGESSVSDLVQGARAGRQDAWNGLVERYAPLVLAVARRYRLQGSDLDDVTQTLWLRLVEHLADIRDPQALPGWIVTTTRNEALRALKLRQRTQLFDPLAMTGDQELAPSAAEELFEPLDAGVVERLTVASRQEALLAAFADLPDRHRDLLLLATDPPVPYAEISARLGMAIGAIGPTRARALQRIRQHPAVAAWLRAESLDEGRPAEHA